ncbi:MAG: TIGR00366 family protein [Tissierellia bacterium]|nr:TIGR00366 family protein [Tissierellia bacterium]
MKKKKFVVPNTYVLIVGFIILAAILTFIIPAGEYAVTEVEGSSPLVDPNSFTFLPQNPVKIGDVLLSVPEGMTNGATVIFLTFLVGGFFQIINDTGTIDLMINGSISRLKEKELLVIPVIMIIMGILGAMGIVVNAAVAFIPIGIALAKKMRLDPVSGAAIMYLGTYAGFATSPMSPFSTLLGQEIAGLPPLSGFTFRTIVMACTVLATVFYVYRYAKKVQDHPELSKQDDFSWEDYGERELIHENFGIRHFLVLAILIGGFVIYGYGAYKLSWGLNHLSAMMMAVGILGGIVGGMTPNKMALSFIEGAKSMVYGALVIGFASAITLVLTKGQVIHSIIYYLTIPLTKVPPILSSIGMFFANLIFNVVVPSGSGQAYIVMPLLSPMADVVGVARQIAVCAYQYGDGMSNIIIPTSGVLMAVLGVGKIPYEKWVRFVSPIFGIWVIIGTIAMIVANLIGLS